MIYNYIGKTLAIYLLSRRGSSGIHIMWLEAFDLQSRIWLWDPTVLIREAVRNLLNRSGDTPVSVMMSSLSQGRRSCLMSSHCEEKFCTTPLTDVRGESRGFLSLSFSLSFHWKTRSILTLVFEICIEMLLIGYLCSIDNFWTFLWSFPQKWISSCLPFSLKKQKSRSHWSTYSESEWGQSAR